MRNFIQAGVYNPLGDRTQPRHYAELQELGVTLSTFQTVLLAKVGVPVSDSVTLHFLNPDVRAYFDTYEVMTSSTALTSIHEDNADGSVTITFTYLPSVIEEIVGQLYLLFKSNNVPQVLLPINLKSFATGTLSCTELVNFPTTELGNTSLSTLTLLNSSTIAPLVLDSLEMTSSVGLDFIIDASVFPIYLDPQQSFDLNIVFAPNANSLRSATVRFLSHGVYIPAIEIALLGTGAIKGVSESTPIVVFDDPAVSLPTVTSGVTGKGLYYQLYVNNTAKIFVVLDYTFNATNATLVYPELIVGTVFSVGETVTIPIRYDSVTSIELPRVVLTGLYI